MPFRSKAQQRFMFATNPAKAKEWASKTKDIKTLPERKHPSMNHDEKPPGIKTASAGGLFFEKRSQPRSGRFFRDMGGRKDGTFHEKAAELNSSGGVGEKNPKATENIETGETGAPIGGMGQKGESMGGGMYGAGKGVKKQAGRTPNDWDADSGLPTGFHRPASTQPEELEAGGERFHSSDVKGTDYGAGEGMTHGLVEGGSMRRQGGSQIGKHAAPRFLGTSYGQEKTASSYAEDRGGEFTRSLGKGVSSAGEALGSVGEAASEGVKSITKSPAASLVAAILLAKFGLRGGKGLGRAAKKGYKRVRHGKPPPPPPPKTLGEKIMGGAKQIGERLGVTK
jgi:hypothetical protein